jgi:nucleoside-diphosphate-sugar epimerase
MTSVIAACSRHRCRLVFFDNVYAYGLVRGAMTEDTPFHPISRKGDVRARIATMLLDAMKSGSVEAMIVRAADFYGPGAALAFTQATVFDRLKQRKTPQWIGDPHGVHTFTYTPDAGRACVTLAGRADAYGQTWHAPTSSEEMTGEQFVRMACAAAGQPYRLRAAPGWMLRIMGLFMPVIRENAEMMYQFEQPYRFDSTRVETRFDLRPTPYGEGIPTTWAPTAAAS